MAQAEDTELRDLIIDALEKNGSLAKIRALLRANIFLAFEDECENIKNNITLDSVLKSPEGILSLSIVHEFLEFCNLKNTLFVYKAETRQGKEYNYEGKRSLVEKFQFHDKDNNKQPILVTIIQNILKPFRRKCYDQGDAGNSMKHEQNGNYIKDDQDCTYIVHDESNSATSNSQSDNSSDEKNKLHLRLHLDNSDTDTSSDSTRDKSSSEYIPNEHIVQNTNRTENTSNTSEDKTQNKHLVYDSDRSRDTNTPLYCPDLKRLNNSNDSTSYVEIKPYNSLEKKMLNTTGIPHKDIDENVSVKIESPTSKPQPYQPIMLKEDVISATLSSVSSIPSNNEKATNISNLGDEGKKSEEDSAEYSLDFTSSESSKGNNVVFDQTRILKSVQDGHIGDSNKKSMVKSPNQNSNSSHSSVSISDVADLIEYSDKNLSYGKKIDKRTDNSGHTESIESSRSSKSVDISKNVQVKFSTDHSGDFSISPVPSLSNLSLDIHSD